MEQSATMIIQDLKNEAIALDLATDQAYLLNDQARQKMNEHIAAGNSQEASLSNVLEESQSFRSRRGFMKTTAAAVLLFSLPDPAAAASGGICVTNGDTACAAGTCGSCCTESAVADARCNDAQCYQRYRWNANAMGICDPADAPLVGDIFRCRSSSQIYSDVSCAVASMNPLVNTNGAGVTFCQYWCCV